MAERSIEETAAEVLRLDAAGTPGPREAEADAIFDRSGDGVCEVRAWSSTAWRRTRVTDEANASLIATYRTAAPELAREVQRLQAAVAYRPGLPSMEQVRAHHDAQVKAHPGLGGCARGCWTVRSHVLDPVQVSLRVEGGKLRIGLHHLMETWDPGPEFEMRPCLPDGTPCPWPDHD